MEYDRTNIDIDPALLPLQTANNDTPLVPPFVRVPGQIATVDGQLGPDIDFLTGAAVNGIAIAVSSAANQITFAISGPGNLAQRNAAATIALLAQTISNPPTQVEVQAISDKVDEIITKLKAAFIVTP